MSRRVKVVSGHGLVLLEIARNPEATVEKISERTGISLRTARRMINDLEAAGALTRFREGNRNRYRIHRAAPLDLPPARMTVGEFIRKLA